MFRSIRCFLVVLVVAASALPVLCDTNYFDFTQVSPGVYAVIAKNGASSNGAFIVNQDDVVVVDTQIRPSWAREVIAEIKKVTNKPVRYVINTHWHRDHVQGNQAYVAAFPGVTVIQQQLTREDQIKNQPVELKTRAPEEIARLSKLLGAGKDEKGKPLSPADRAQLQHLLDLQHEYVAEIPQIQLVPGNLTFDQSMSMHEGGREIDLYYYGYAHSRGDLVVYLPAEKIVMTGDVLESEVPIMRTAYPTKLLNFLASLQKLDWNVAIPGHGDIQHGKDTINQYVAYLSDLAAAVKQSVAKGLTEDQTVKAVDLSKYSKLPDYDDRNESAIRRTYLEFTGKIPD